MFGSAREKEAPVFQLIQHIYMPFGIYFNNIAELIPFKMKHRHGFVVIITLRH